MTKLLGVSVVAAVVLGAAGAPARAADREAIDKAINRGVEGLRRMQQANGTWPHQEIGATALAGLTLLECGAAADDKDVRRAADAVRQTSVNVTYTYSVALCILFLDRLGDSQDVPLIESLTVRLLAGQQSSGGWNYQCPPIGETEVRRLTTGILQRKELVGRREEPKPGKRTVKDLPREIQQQLAQIQHGAAGPLRKGSDNSNTQFATLALWVGRRQGLPVDKALARVESRFRASQNADGGWGYFDSSMAGPGRGMLNASTASMTCAGLLGIAVADGAVIEAAHEKNPRGKPPRDLSKDPALRKGLLALSTAIGTPAGPRRGPAERAPAIRVGGKTYYFLWSLERVAVALNLDTIGKKDWYAWGAEILLANQQADGSWQGEYGACGADTCFALLFLKRANLARDLSAHLKGQIQDEKVLQAGGVGGAGLTGATVALKSGIESKTPQPIAKPIAQPAETKPPKPADPKPDRPAETRGRPVPSEESDSGRLAGELVKAPAGKRTEMLEKLRSGKGVKYTEALASAIPRLEGDSQRRARAALAERLTRMKADTLANYLQDEDVEIRRAAVEACAKKEARTLIPNLIALLRDREAPVVGAAHVALKNLTGEDFGPAPGAGRADREQAAQRWLEWWKKQGGK